MMTAAVEHKALDLFTTCIHEAGHAVAYLAHGHNVWSAQVAASGESFTNERLGREMAGFVEASGPEEYVSTALVGLEVGQISQIFSTAKFQKSLKRIRQKHFFEHAIALAAGYTAQAKFTGNLSDFNIYEEEGISSDVNKIHGLAERLFKTGDAQSRWLNKVEAAARDFVNQERNWTAICKIAEALSGEGCLSSDRIREIFDEADCSVV